MRRGLATSRDHARSLIVAGRVLVDGSPTRKPTRQVSAADALVVSGPPPRFVGRGAHKLEAALVEFDIDVTDRRCIDAGSSTGGFTDCLLQRGAASVVAVDVGRNQLHERLRADMRVTSLEQTDIRDFVPDKPAQVVVVDLSFISTIGLLPTLAQLVDPDGDLVILIKPQFEAGRIEVSRGKGVITSRDTWVRVLHACIDAAPEAGLEVVGLALSPITGGRTSGKGNVEFLAHLRRVAPVESDILYAVVENDGPNRHER